MVLIPQRFMPMIDAIAAKHPRLKFVIDHLGLVNGEKDDVDSRLDLLLALGKRPNVAVKSSALPCYTAEAYPYPGLQKHLKRIHDAFGRQRVFWGTDQSRSPIPYRHGVELFTKHTPFLTEGDSNGSWEGVRTWLDWKQ
jgi:predicted TIM-barrel fold metal-dependent hydrolase